MEDFDFKSFYDQQSDYASFRNDPAKRHEYDVAVNWKVKNLCSLVPDSLKFSNVLEVGCALGILLNKVADSLNIKERFGVDISDENINLACKLFPACTFIQGTTENIKSDLLKDNPGKRFDLLVLSDIVEHIPEDYDFMKENSRISSYVLFNLPLEKCFMTRNRKYGVEDPSGHLRKYNLQDAVKLVEKSGFGVVASFCTNSHFDKEHFLIYRRNRIERLRKKSFLKRVFWSLFYFKLDIIKSVAPGIYIRIFGSNYFALLKPVSQGELD